MFTGIIENVGIIDKVEVYGGNRVFRVCSELSEHVKVDQSISHNGVCLTVEAVFPGSYQVTAIEETLAKTNLNRWQNGTFVNLERCLQMNGRIDGHIIQGHVDTIATCVAINIKDGSTEFTFETLPGFENLMIEKGSISVNGVSLTLFNVKANTFTVALIPYTLKHTNLQYLLVGDTVNIEFDMIGKYVQKAIAVNQGNK